jgi:hypothetical protein
MPWDSEGSLSLPAGTFNLLGALIPGTVLTGSEEAAAIAGPDDPVFGLLASYCDGNAEVWSPGSYEMLEPSFNPDGLLSAWNGGVLDLAIGDDGRLAHVPGRRAVATLLERSSASRLVIALT